MDTQPRKFFLKQILRKVFLEDWVMKLVALAITLALWFGVTGLSTPTTQRLTSVKFNLQNYSNNIEVTNSPIQEVDLIVSGDKRKLAQIEKNELLASTDISDVMPGDRVISLTPENVFVSLPTGVRLDGINPARIAVRIEAVEEKEVEVRSVTTGEIPAGFELYSETATPAKVRVRGPASFIRSLDAVETERIDLSNRTSDFTVRQVPIILANPKASLPTETVVDVSFRIGEKRIERVYVVPVDGRRAIVTLYGGQSLFDGIRPEDIRIEIARNDNGDPSPHAILPPGLADNVEIRSVKLRGGSRPDDRP